MAVKTDRLYGLDEFPEKTVKTPTVNEQDCMTYFNLAKQFEEKGDINNTMLCMNLAKGLMVETHTKRPHEQFTTTTVDKEYHSTVEVVGDEVEHCIELVNN